MNEGLRRVSARSTTSREDTRHQENPISGCGAPPKDHTSAIALPTLLVFHDYARGLFVIYASRQVPSLFGVFPSSRRDCPSLGCIGGIRAKCRTALRTRSSQINQALQANSRQRFKLIDAVVIYCRQPTSLLINRRHDISRKFHSYTVSCWNWSIAV